MEPIAERNNFDELIATIKSLIPATYYEDECSKRYKASFSLKEFEAELSDDLLILEGNCKSEICGISYEDKGANQNAVDPNKYHLEGSAEPWRGVEGKAHNHSQNTTNDRSLPWDV